MVIAALRLEVLGGEGNVQLAARLTKTSARLLEVAEGAARAELAKKPATARRVEMEMETMVDSRFRLRFG
jgi:hypothetical protein